MKKNKLRLFACVMAVMCCMAAFSVTAFASDGGYYESNENGDNTPPDSIDSISVSTEGVKLPENQGSEPLTPDGNLSLIDDILQDESYFVSDEKVVKDKQFITVQSKNGNYFYIVIDRSGDTENVYFLNLVDEADLMALMEDGNKDETVCTCTDKCVAGDVNTSCPVCSKNTSECAGKEAVTETPKPDTSTESDTEQNVEKEQSGSNNGILLIVLVLVIAGGGALYWFKFRKPKTNTKGDTDLDNYPFEQDEDEPEETEIDDSEVMAEAMEEVHNAENKSESEGE